MSRDAGGRGLNFSGPLRDQLHQARFFSEMAAADAPRRIGVVACHRFAGTSTVALNFAAMLHERSGQPTLLAETNLRHPVLASRWGLSPAGGLNRLLAGASEAEAGLAQLDGGLKLLVAHPVAEPLASLRDGVPALLQAAAAYRHTVFDLPPALDCPDATVLGPALDAFILVLEAETTRWQVARQACEQLQASGVPLLGAVLNKRPMPIPGWLYRLL